MQRGDIRAVSDLAGEASSVLTTLVRGMHAGIASRVFNSIGPTAVPTRTIHDGVTNAIYAGVARGLRGATHAVGAVAAEVWGDDGHDALESRIKPAAFMAAVNGIYGDELTERENRLAGAMAIRHRGQPVALTAESLAAAFPAATNRVAIFVHGWCLTERSWSRPPRANQVSQDSRNYGERLHGDLGFSAVYLRYNTGLHISVNGRTLAEILKQVYAQWPVPVTELVLVGHSMGGLVARSACHYATQQQHDWTGAVSHVVCLGSPHLGADLEKGVNVASWALARLPETRAIAAFLNARSDGVKDLRYGACLDEDWCDGDPDEFLRDRCHDAPFLPHATYHFVSSTVAPPLLGTIAGDHLVRSRSAAGLGKSRRIPFDSAHGLTLTGLNHFDLLNHPLVYAKLHDWLTPSSAED
ncbi:MAG: alpha/beta fold hydrolase [Mycobacterium sp.]|nr:alpha/beta fold hydrolase [Mycobacterium sp.]MBV9721860.1 alpha/beta fold hydrolase [Mycobacterium sp.]